MEVKAFLLKHQLGKTKAKSLSHHHLKPEEFMTTGTIFNE